MIDSIYETRTNPYPHQLYIDVSQVLPVDEIAMFDVSELELMLCGVPSLDIEDWQAHTDYKSGAKKQKRVAGVVQNAPTRSTYMTLGMLFHSSHYVLRIPSVLLTGQLVVVQAIAPSITRSSSSGPSLVHGTMITGPNYCVSSQGRLLSRPEVLPICKVQRGVPTFRS